jgi:hypothetical protein
MNAQKPTLLDCAFKLLDSPSSPQDFTLILHFNQPPDSERLHAGAKSACESYGTGSKISTDTRIDIERFVNERFHPDPTPIKQMFDGHTLASRFHHAAADGLSAALWLGHQLSVAYGLTPPARSAELSLRRAETSVRRSQFAYDGACDRLWTPNATRTGTRHWMTFSFCSTELRQACRQAGGFTYSDLLATCALETLRQWNLRHSRNGPPQVGLWLPMNIRSRSFEGFGNGTSRVRLYARYPSTASIIEKTREVRRQVSWTTEHGEWAIPELPLLTHLPAWITAPLLNRYLNRPSIDMATGVFSHADRWAGDAREAFQHVDRIECIGLLHPRQNLAINGATHRDKTWMTFTSDTGLLRDSDVDDLVEMYKQQILVATTEFEENKSGRGQA